MDLHLTGKVVVITGGATGIGKATAIEFMKEGAQVAVFGRRTEVLEAFAKECEEMGFSLYYDRADVADTPSVERFAENVYQKFGAIDVWVNNAGVIRSKEFTEFTQEDWDFVEKINLEGVFHGTQIAAKYMKKGNGGVILNASSFAALIPHANGALYAATKAAVSSLTRSTAAALAPYGIRVVAYIPGMIVSEISVEFTENEDKYVKDISMKRLGTPEDLAKPLVFLASDAAGYISGCNIEVTGGKFAAQDCMMGWRMEAEKQNA